MSRAHPTVEAEQTKTDTFAVFGDQSAQLDPHDDLVLIGRVEVPRYSQPTADGVELSPDKRHALAVYRAVQQSRHNPPEGEEFMVMYDVEEPMAFAEYEENPAFDGVWNPEEEA